MGGERRRGPHLGHERDALFVRSSSGRLDGQRAPVVVVAAFQVVPMAAATVVVDAFAAFVYGQEPVELFDFLHGPGDHVGAVGCVIAEVVGVEVGEVCCGGLL